MSTVFVPNGNASHHLTPDAQEQLRRAVAANGRLPRAFDVAIANEADDLPTVFYRSPGGSEVAVGFLCSEDQARGFARSFPELEAPPVPAKPKAPEVDIEATVASAVAKAVAETRAEMMAMMRETLAGAPAPAATDKGPAKPE
jgi:hypothetical protein